MKWLFTALVAVLTALDPALAQPPVPIGDEFQVNSYTTGRQIRPFAEYLPSEDFIVVWESDGSAGSDNSGDSVQGRHFRSDGSPKAEDFQINTNTELDQIRASIAVAGNGDFTVVWGSDRPYVGREIRARRYDSNLLAQGSDFQVNESFQDTYLRSGYRSVASTPDGEFTVVWDASDYMTSDSTIHGRLFDQFGAPAGGDLDLVEHADNKQFLGSVAADSVGIYCLVWSEYQGYPRGIFGQVFDFNGVPQGGAFKIAKRTNPPEGRPDVHTSSGREFIAVWESGDGIHARRLDASGQALGSEFRASSISAGLAQRFPRVAGLADGSFVIVWQTVNSVGPDTDGTSIQGRLFAQDGTPVGADFLINSYTTGDQERPTVAGSRSTGEFVVACHSNGSGGSDDQEDSIQGQRFSTTVQFIDGFESGDTSAWSSTVQ